MKNRILAGLAVIALASGSASAQSDSEREKARANFRQADTNEDGLLSRSEFRTFINANAEDGLGRAGMIRRLGAYDRAFDRIDADKNGLLTPAEMSAARGE